MEALPAGAPPLEEWHPKTRRLFEYWSGLRPGPGILPGRQHFDPLDVPELLAELLILEYVSPPDRLRYRLIGTKLVKTFGREVTGQWYDEVHPEAARSPEYAETVARLQAGNPFWRRGRALSVVDPQIYQIELLHTPLARDGRNVDMAVSVLIYSYRNGA
jgi:hypothetical protein